MAPDVPDTRADRLDQPVRLAAVAATSTQVASTRSRKAKVTAIAELLAAAGDPDAALVAAYLSGVVPQGRLGVGWRSLAETPVPATAAALTLRAVDGVFSELAATAGPGSVQRRRELLTGLLSAATAAEQRFLTGLIRGELRQGALDAVVIQAVAQAAGLTEDPVRRAAMLAGSVSGIVEPALRGGEAALGRIGLQVGTPVLPMLAASAPDVVSALAEGGVRLVERKLDGIRIQAHRRDEEVSLFTRSLEDITDRLPEVAERIARLDCRAAVLDGEVIALRPDGRPEPFQVTGARTASRTDAAELAGRAPLTTWLFDVLHIDGEDLLDLPLAERRARLTALLGTLDADLLVPGVLTDDAAEAGAFFTRTVADGHEGVVVKDPGSAYAAGRRGRGWVKVKPRHTLDLMVLAVEWGSGRRRGWLSNIHLGARDPATGEFVMVGKTFKGMTDAMLSWQTDRFTELAVERGDWVVTVRPEQVVEIAFDGVQRSSRYPGGVALRFARVLRYRDDKTAAEVDSLPELRQLAGLD